VNNVSLISAIVSLAGAVTTAVLGGVFEWRRRRADREQARRDLVSRFGAPLVQASVQLAWRLRNAIDQFAGKRVKETPLGSDRQDDYNLYETLYRLAAFLGWVEILYRDAHFLDLGNRRRNRRFLQRLAAADSAIAGGSGPGAPFVLLSGERRAIGEVMVAPDSDSARCLGYVEFRRRYESDEEFRRWFAPAVDQLSVLVETKPAGAVRQLTHAHNTLIELVDFLDPRKTWVDTPRDKLELPAGTSGTGRQD